MIVGVFLGVYSAQRPNGISSHFVSFFALFGYSAPVFWSGLLLLIGFSLHIQWFPVAGIRDVTIEGNFFEEAIDVIRHMVLPVITLASIFLALYSRLSRATMMEVLGSDYIRTAKSKGLTDREIIYKHALKNSLSPVITLAGLQFSAVVSGAILVESVFSWPGLGTLAFESIIARDTPTILGILFFSALVVIVGNLLTDLPLSLVDPRVRTNIAAVIALIILFLIILVAIFGPTLYPVDPFDMVWMPFSPPGEEGFIFGTDYLGRDLVAMIIHGARVSIIIGVSAAFVTVFIGVSVGAMAGFYRGWVEEVLMRITEFFQVLPTLLFAMVIVALFGASLTMITIAIGAVSWTAVARITRAEFLRIRELEYVTASRASGANNFILMFGIILPNALPPIIVQAALMVGSAILFEAGLSFLGLTDPNVVSWGQVIGSNRSYLLDAGFTVTIPGAAIFITVLCISLVGDGLNDALNPKLRQR